MTGLINVFLCSLFFNLSLSPYRSIIAVKAKGDLTDLLQVNSNLEIERDLRTNRERKYAFGSFAGSIYPSLSVKGSVDRTVERIRSGIGESKGGIVEFNGYKRSALFKIYFECREYKRDTAFFNPGFGIVLSKRYTISGFLNDIRVEYKSFGKFRNTALYYRAFSDKKEVDNSVNYSFGLNLRGHSLPYGLVSVDTRLYRKGYGEISYSDENKGMKFSMDYTVLSSVKVASMNYKRLNGKVQGNMVALNKILRTYVSVQYVKKAFFDGGYESQWNYEYNINLERGWVRVISGISMKRFDYFSLVPLDRDERNIIFGVDILGYQMNFERMDINYIRSQYVSNSRTMKRYVILSKVHSFSIRNVSFGYQGRLFAGIFTPIYTKEKGYYQRYWENKFFAFLGDSTLYLTLNLRYKQIGEFKNDSVFNPYEDLEYVENFRYRVVRKNRTRVYFEQHADILSREGIREWKMGIYIDTGIYTAKFSTGELMRRKSIYVEFSSWI